MSLFQRGKMLKERYLEGRQAHSPHKTPDFKPIREVKTDAPKDDPARNDADQNCVNGRGMKKLPQGGLYEGEFKNSRFHGRGTLTFANGRQYTGEFAEGKIQGAGVMLYPKGTVYNGQLKNGLRHGQGILRFKNGYEYTGRFENGHAQGQGTLTFPNGKKYVGWFKNGRFDGTGTLIYPSGTVYEGRFLNDMRHGRGIMTYPSGFRFEGEFQHDKACGYGILTFPDGTRYAGQFNNDKRNGQGILTYPNGLKYSGGFKNDKYHGNGTLRYPDGRVFEGKFENDKCVEPGVMTYPDGAQKTGRFVSGRFHQEPVPSIKADDAPEKVIDQYADKISACKTESRKACFRASDGHYVHSQTQMIVDNWLYMMGIVHVYEPRLPVAEEIYSDFYLPAGNVYIDCSRIAPRKGEKAAGKKHHAFNRYEQFGFYAIFLEPDDIYSLDDILARQLITYHISPRLPAPAQ